MHREPEQFPQPDPAGAGQPPAPVAQNSSDPTPKNDASSKRIAAEALGLYVMGLEAKVAAIPIPDDPLGEAGQRYDALTAWYQKHIASARARLEAMRQ